MSIYDYDLFVVGAGSGGVRVARRAARAGIKVGIAEASAFGGTCVNKGCIPKKLYVYSSHYQEDFIDSKGYGWETNDGKPSDKFSWKVLQQNKNQEILRLNGIYRNLLADAGVQIFYAKASLLDEHTLDLQDVVDQSHRKISSEKILIVTGSLPKIPSIPGEEYLSSSDHIFFQEKLPERIVILGGGYIAVEFAGIFSSLGVETKLLYRGDLFLRGFDGSIRRFFYEEMQKKGISLHFQTSLLAVKKQKNNSLLLSLEDGSSITTDQVLSATGRTANTKGIGLERVGVEMNSNNSLKVDEQFCTNIPSVYALGDVIGRIQLTPVAIAEAMYFVRTTILKEKIRPFSYENIPTTIFSQPSIGTVGLSEEEAKKRDYNVKVYKNNFQELKHTLSGRSERSLVKLIVDGEEGRVLGAHMVGREAGEIIQGIAVALKAGATKKDFDDTIGVHPTCAEEFVTL